MSNNTLSKLSLEEIAKQIAHQYLKSPNGFDLEAFCFQEQFQFISDPAKFKVAVCSRRSGKTVACAAHLIHEAINKPGRVCLYITLSRINAKRIIWSELLSINRRYQLEGETNETELSISFPNGSIIYLSGAKDKSEIEKFRGLAISLCYIDECQSFRSYIKELIDDVIGPSLMDYAGSLCLIGTPGPLPSGYFYDCSQPSSAWSRHSWTFWQNPFISQKSGLSHQEILQNELTRRGIVADDPSIQREFFGKWVLDSDSLLYHYTEAKNHYDVLPQASYNYIMGIDLGFKDADAIAILAWSEASAVTYLVEEVVQDKQGITELVDEIQRLQKKYDVSKMVIDEGGLGKKIAEEIRRRHHIPVQAAEKQRKMETVAFLNDHLRTGRFMAHGRSRFAQDSYLVEIDRDKSTPDRIRVKDTYHSDICDAVLYAFKESPAFTYRPPRPVHKWGTPQWQEEEVERMIEAMEEQVRKEQELTDIDYI